MRRAPRDPAEALVTWRSGARILGEGALLAAGVLSIYLWTVWWDGSGASASRMAFTALVLIHPFQAMSCRSERLNWWQLRPNPWIPLSLVALFALQWFAITWAPLARVLGTRPLTGADWLAVALGVLWPVALLEAVKAWGRFTTVRLADPTAATRAGPPSTTRPRKN